MKGKRKSKPKRRRANKKVRNATILEYYGITFKSKLELYCYKKLKEANIKFQYEKVRYELMPSFEFENVSYELYKKKGERFFGPQRKHVRAVTYTPDFVGEYNGRKFIIETKGNPNDAFPLRWKMFKKYIYDSNMKHDIYMPRNQKHVDEVVEVIKNIGK